MANYPTSVSTDANLYIAKNQLATTLNGSIDASQTSIILTSATGFPTAGAVTIDSEVVFYTGISTNTLTGCTRGADGTGATTHSSGAAVRHTVVAFHHNGLKDEVIAVETALGANLSNVVQTTGNQTISGTKDFTGQLLGKGTATNDAAAAGYIGESVSSAAQTNTDTAASDVIDDLTSISLTAGDWDISAMAQFNNNGATWSQAFIGISSTSGNSTAGLVLGSNRLNNVWANSSTTPTSVGICIASFRVSLSATTTYYLKRLATFTAGTPRTQGYRLSARRVR